MKKNLSKIVSALLCIAMILAFTACGSGDSADEGERQKSHSVLTGHLIQIIQDFMLLLQMGIMTRQVLMSR